MCLYLYAMFSLKRRTDEGISESELKAINGWRRTILGVALEEMTHLTLVANLASSIGGSPNFMRPNFPSFPGYYPADIIMELARFDMSTLDHFIYLERPRSQERSDGGTFEHLEKYSRLSEKGRLMPNSGDYETIGELYLSIRSAFETLCEKHGEKNLLCGARSQQIGPLDSPLPGLTLVSSKEEALRAIDTIIAQGEGATDVTDSHFQKFCKIKDEFTDLLKNNPNFVPSRDAARNPVMRKPVHPEGRVWVNEPIAAQFMDLANALYGMLLRVLVQIYAIDQRPKDEKKLFLNSSYRLMHAMGTVGEILTHLPSSIDRPEVLSGMSFAMVRSLAPLGRIAEKVVMRERLLEVIERASLLQTMLDENKISNPRLVICADQLSQTLIDLIKIREEFFPKVDDLRMIEAQSFSPAQETPTNFDRSVKESAKTSSAFAHQGEAQSAAQIEISETDKIELRFEAKKCIHARHCVTELPRVFKANTPGKWIFAENTEAEILAAVARECPSGAIQYRRKDGGADELTPEVNMMRLRENGPYAFLGDLVIDGAEVGARATLCRCGQSSNKPFCDGTHNSAKFTASGEPKTLDDTSLKIRSGKLKIDRTNNGPLSVEGNVEICSGTGRIVLRTSEVRLCRCGNSKNKPICDNSHVAADFRDAGH